MAKREADIVWGTRRDHSKLLDKKWALSVESSHSRTQRTKPELENFYRQKLREMKLHILENM